MNKFLHMTLQKEGTQLCLTIEAKTIINQNGILRNHF